MGTPFTMVARMPLGYAWNRLVPPGRSATSSLRPGLTDGHRIEHHEVGPVADLDQSPVPEAQDVGGYRGELADPLLERPLPEVEYPAPQEVRAVVGAVVP